MTAFEKQAEAGTLPYERVRPERPIPVWKHFVFAPLLFWVGVFFVGMVVLLTWGLWGALTGQ